MLTNVHQSRPNDDSVREMFQKLRELCGRICDASEIEDAVLHAVRKQDLRDYHRTQTEVGFWHPALTEAMAGFAEDTPTRIKFYRLAIEQGKALQQPTYTALLDLAHELHEVGRTEEAEACLRDGRAQAQALGDSFWIENADRYLAEMQLPPA